MAALHGQQNTITLPRSVEREMSGTCTFRCRKEACGVVLGESAAGGIRISRFQPIRNVAPDPLHHFSLDQSEWIQCLFSEVTIVGIFHTHPRTLAIPSHEDLQALPNFAGMIQTYLIRCTDRFGRGTGFHRIRTATKRGSISPYIYTLAPMTLRVT